MNTILWYDIETTGISPQCDRINQFAAIRTDLELNTVDEPINIICQPAEDVLPSPEAALVTGITPQFAQQNGLLEGQFINFIHQQFSQPNSCGVGYNSIRFDDEFMRYTLYRNFFDPYEREWKNGNSRWDIIDMVRLVYALRPDTLNWPSRTKGEASADDDGFIPSFALEKLAIANNLTHESAHDALSDVTATIELAKLIKQRQPKLYDYCWKLRRKQNAIEHLNFRALKPILHISSKFSASRACASVVLPIMQHPVNSNGIVVIDLAQPLESIDNLTPEIIHQRMYGSNEELQQQGLTRLPIKVIHVNRSPIVATTKLINKEAEERMQLPSELWQQHHQQWLEGDRLNAFKNSLNNALKQPFEGGSSDPEHTLYEGFLSPNDKRLGQQIVSCTEEQLRDRNFIFDAPKMNELLWRYRARNYYATLSVDEQQQWQEFCQQRLTDPSAGCKLVIDDYQRIIDELIEKNGDKNNGRELEILQSLKKWGQYLLQNTAPSVG